MVPTKPITLLDGGAGFDAAPPPGRGQVFLVAYHRNGADVIALPPNQPLILGRDRPSDALLPDPSVSRQHARFSCAGGVTTVEDLGSTNGTLVAGKRVERAELRPGQEVALGGVRVVVHAAMPAAADVLGLDSHERFRRALDEELTRARHFRRPCAVLMVRAGRPDLHVSDFSPRVRASLRDVDRMALYSSDAVEILCPELDADRALELGRVLCEGPSESGPLLVGIAVFPATSLQAEELVARSLDAAYGASVEHPVELSRTGAWAPEAPARRVEGGADPIIASDKMRRVLDLVARFARATLPVLIHGATGSGKEVVAHAIHAASSRRHKRMMVVNCGAIPEQLIESTLFGHLKGTFTGAIQDQKGVFEAADGSTVFLDEIGELSPAAQAALLRVLDTNRVTRVGATRETEVDVRVIAATHRDLEAMCAKGGFRQDLFFRLNAMTLSVPPLRDRPDDLEPLLARFLAEANQATSGSVRGVTPSALRLLKGYAWPGNVRELRNAIHRAVAIAQEALIGDEDLPERVLRAAGEGGAGGAGGVEVRAVAAAPVLLPAGLKATLKQAEIQLIVAALGAAGDNQTEAARRLKVPLRTLAHKIKTLGIRKRGFGVS